MKNLCHLLVVVDAHAERRSLWQNGTESKISFLQCRNKFTAHNGKNECRENECYNSNRYNRKFFADSKFNYRFVNALEEIHDAIADVFLVRDFFRKKQGRHHRHISERKNDCSYNGEGNSHCHWTEHFSFNTDQRKDWDVNNENNDLPESGRACNTC